MPGHQSVRISASARHSLLLKYPIRHICSLITCHLLASILCSCCQFVAHRLKLLCRLLTKFLAGWSSPCMLVLPCLEQFKVGLAALPCKSKTMLLVSDRPSRETCAQCLLRGMYEDCTSPLCSVYHHTLQRTHSWKVHEGQDVLSFIWKLILSALCSKDDFKSIMLYSSSF